MEKKVRIVDYETIRDLFDEEYIKTRDLIRQGETHLNTLAEGFSRADEIIKNLPVADVREVKRGEWICLEQEIGLFECSLCDHRILRTECNFCPNCGADMRKTQK